MTTISGKPLITVDGNLSDWTTSDLINFGDGTDYSIFARAQDGMFYFAIGGPLPIGPNTTAWFNTDQNATTGYQIFGFAGGAEFNLNINSDGTAALYSGGAGETLVLDNIQLAYSADQKSIEFAIPIVTLGNPAAIDTVYDVNDSVFLPGNYSAQPYTVVDGSAVTRTDPTHRIGIVYSATTAANYFSATAYGQLFMAAQSQAMQAGISFDLLTEADLTNLSKLANYDALVFPSFSNVQASQVTAITDTLEQATRQFGVGLITAGNFMTNDATGAALPGDSYARMKLLFDATRITGGTGDVTINSSDANQAVFSAVAPGALIHSYSQVGWDAFKNVSGTGQTIATETVDGQTYAAALATQTTGGKNVLFSSAGVMADSNLLWQAIDYAAKDPGISVSLDLTRFNGIVASRTDMDQAQESTDVSPGPGLPGIDDKLLPILEQWKLDYNFVGSYYVDIGNDPANGQFTDWAVSAPYYAQLLAMGNELGSHSYTHPEDTNTLSPAQIQFEFQQSKQVLEQQMSAYLGTPFTVSGAAVPGAPETVLTAEQIIQYFNYLNGGYASIGSGYPGAFGFLTPDLTNAVYLAPNTSFDFTLVEFQNLGAAGAEAAWAQEWNQLVANANCPIVVWPWHDYGPTQWPVSGTTSTYTTQMYTDWIQRAYQAGDEFVTAADLASRIQSFAQSGVTSTVNGNVITVTVASAHAGDFALNVAGEGSQAIANVANWYAYDNNSLFLPETGGNYTITLGVAADDVTHITSLPMRGDLVSVTGDGLNLGFSMFGEGQVVIDLGAHGNMVPIVTGATISSLVGDQLDLTLTGLGEHDVSLHMVTLTPAEVVSTVSFSTDTGSSLTDFVTNTAAQTISGTLSAALGAGDVVKVSLDNGTTWLTATAAAGATTFSLPVVTLTGSGALVARVENAGVASTAFTHAYVLDQVSIAPSTPDLSAASDSGVSPTDNVTNLALPNFSGTGEDGATVTLFDGTTTIGTGTVAAGGAWSITPTIPLTDGNNAITATQTDLAGNVSAVSGTLIVRLDTAAPAAPSTPDLSTASDSGVSDTDNITAVTSPTFTGAAEDGSTVTLRDGTTVIGSAIATGGAWSITASPLANGPHSITAKAMDVAGNVGTASGALSVTIDDAAPVSPSVPDLLAASDSGTSNTDNITNVAKPTFVGTAAIGSRVTLYDGAAAIGTGIATAAGNWTIIATTLTSGTHSITAKTMDVAGNSGTVSGALSVTIDDVAPAAPSVPDLLATSDSGSSNTDNITSVTTPTFIGTAESGSTVTLLDGATVIGTAVATAAGVWTISASALPAGPHRITAQTEDVAGNLGAASAALPVTIEASAPITNPAIPTNFAITDVTTGNSSTSAGVHYTGPVAGLTDELILVSPDNINVAAIIPNVFIHTGSGDDALNVSRANGNNVLDGGTGSNFLTGGSGKDTFFVDDRVATADIWSSVVGFGAGDAATIWGVTPQDFGLTWVDGQGAAGFSGLTLHAAAAGKPTASLTLAGYSQADLNNGRLSVMFGTDPSSGSTYMYVHGNS